MPETHFAGCLAMISDKPEDITNAQTYCDEPAEIVEPVLEPGVFACIIERVEYNNRLHLKTSRATLF